MQLLLLVSKVISFQNVNNSNNVTGGGVDYDSGPYIVTFPAGVTSASFDIIINDDNVLEDDEVFRLIIDLLPNRVTVYNRNTTFTILDIDSK